MLTCVHSAGQPGVSEHNPWLPASVHKGYLFEHPSSSLELPSNNTRPTVLFSKEDYLDTFTTSCQNDKTSKNRDLI